MVGLAGTAEVPGEAAMAAAAAGAGGPVSGSGLLVGALLLGQPRHRSRTMGGARPWELLDLGYWGACPYSPLLHWKKLEEDEVFLRALLTAGVSHGNLFT